MVFWASSEVARVGSRWQRRATVLCHLDMNSEHVCVKVSALPINATASTRKRASRRARSSSQHDVFGRCCEGRARPMSKRRKPSASPRWHEGLVPAFVCFSGQQLAADPGDEEHDIFSSRWIRCFEWSSLHISSYIQSLLPSEQTAFLI